MGEFDGEEPAGDVDELAFHVQLLAAVQHGVAAHARVHPFLVAHRRFLIFADRVGGKTGGGQEQTGPSEDGGVGHAEGLASR